jgi:hypothetical protein
MAASKTAQGEDLFHMRGRGAGVLSLARACARRESHSGAVGVGVEWRTRRLLACARHRFLISLD